ncbi:transcriptional regulator [Sphingomonas parva]|uniref:Transcriptional regulator n=1 Tax=Sphingomonas parva TaxID=2555898 RepID=A0A4Y8ZQ02_9SPHN|nr:helix-turn-helix domain-containing protein [Sphingomonas parva]TFI57205.1 transcriptional regulator [Sphingomonas parva]
MTRAEHLKALFTGCGIAAALEVVGERWSFLILRGAFNGLEHFEEFQSTLGIARNILSNRLVRLVEHGILAREPDPSDRRRVAYKLTEKGAELMPVLIALRQWGERWICHQPGNLVLVDKRTRMPIPPMTVRATDGRILAPNDLEWVERAHTPEEDAA